MNRSRRGVLGVVAINLALLAAGIVALELVFGNWRDPNRMNRLNLLRDVTLTYATAGLYDGAPERITYTRDRYGFRGPYPAPSAIDILTIGGSATDQRYIADGQTWQDVLAAGLSRPGRPVSVVNAGVDGQSTIGHLRNFQWWFPYVPGLRPRFVLYYVGVNDFLVRAANDELVAAPSWLTTLRDSSALYAMAVKARGLYRARVSAGLGHARVDFSRIAWTRQPALDDHTVVLQPFEQQYRERLRLLMARTTALGATPICVTQASRYYRGEGSDVVGVAQSIPFGDAWVNGVDFFHIMIALDKALFDECGGAGGVTLDAARQVAWTDADFYDFLHNTPAGARKLGEYLHANLMLYFEGVERSR